MEKLLEQELHRMQEYIHEVGGLSWGMIQFFPPNFIPVVEEAVRTAYVRGQASVLAEEPLPGTVIEKHQDGESEDVQPVWYCPTGG